MLTHNLATLSPEVPEADVYAAHATLIESVLSAACRVHRLSADAADEFQSWTRVKLLEREQSILHKFAGRSSFRTYLVTVVEHLFMDWRNHEWGKWRPSSAARRLGPLAIELEKRVLRDGNPFGEVSQTLVAHGFASSTEECERVWTRLPQRPRRQIVDVQDLADLPASSTAADHLEAQERVEERAKVLRALEAAIAELPESDQAVLRLRYWSGTQVSRLAALTGADQKQLYRRFERIQLELRRRLEQSGIVTSLNDVFDGFDPEVERVASPDESEKAWVRPSSTRGSEGPHV